MMNKKGLTLSIVFKAQSLNYGEGIGNISELKKLSRGMVMYILCIKTSY